MKKVPRWLAVSLGFAAFVLVSLVVAVVGYRGSFVDRCTEYCVSKGKRAEVVPLFPRTMTGNRPSPENCECR